MASDRHKRESGPRRPSKDAAAGRPHRGRYRLELKPSVERSLAALEKRDRVRVARRIDALADDPRPAGVEKLSGEDDLWRIRVGDFRVIYAIRDEMLLILVVRVGHRRDVYRKHT